MNIKLFATLKERAKADVVSIQLTHAITVKEFRAAVAAQHPVLSPLMAQTLVAINQEFAFNDDTVHPTDEVALFPPVSGG